MELFSQTCPENMIPIPAEENSKDWTCGCKEFYLFFPETNSCHEAYKQGPCPPENYLVLPPGEKVARCEKNPCLKDGLVFFEGSCASLYNPCGNSEKSLKLKEFDFKIRCSRSPVRATNIVTAPAKKCPKGTRRDSAGNCRRVVNG